MKRIDEILKRNKILNKLKKECKYYWIGIARDVGRCHLTLNECYFCKNFEKEEKC